MKKREFLFFICLMVAGCGTHFPTYEDTANSKLIQANSAAADRLLASLKQPLDKSVPLVVTALSSVDSPTEPSRLGRMASEYLEARLTKLGYRVIRLELRDAAFVKQRKGELLLLREVMDVARSHGAQAVIVGMYSESKESAYFDLKIVSVQGNMTIGAYDYIFPLDRDVQALLAKGLAP
ncbi:MAG TPA: FlgO family outer membrane protein [Sulfuricella sp.]|nr:FlgO family outer membrane protein [Sulfuricella sp.]